MKTRDVIVKNVNRLRLQPSNKREKTKTYQVLNCDFGSLIPRGIGSYQYIEKTPILGNEGAPQRVFVSLVKKTVRRVGRANTYLHIYRLSIFLYFGKKRGWLRVWRGGY